MKNKPHRMGGEQENSTRSQASLIPGVIPALGVIPLLQDVFWVGLAVSIMAGLSTGTILTMILVPVLYVTLCRPYPASEPAEAALEPLPDPA